MRLTVVGSGDAFGSGGRLQACFHVETRETRFLIDCGASSMIGLNRAGLNPNDIGTVYISHLHGDHFPGLVWMLLHGQYVSLRSNPLTVVGPRGTEQRLMGVAEALFPGSTQVNRRFDLQFVEFDDGMELNLDGMNVRVFAVNHPSGALSAALRFECDGLVVAYSGDTEWVQNVGLCGREADLFVCECYSYDKAIPYHMNWVELAEKFGEVGARRYLITHMNESMLRQRSSILYPNLTFAEDGMIIDLVAENDTTAPMQPLHGIGQT